MYLFTEVFIYLFILSLFIYLFICIYLFISACNTEVFICFSFIYLFICLLFLSGAFLFGFGFAGDGAGKAFMEKYVAQPRLPEHARYGKAKEMVEKKVLGVPSRSNT